MAPSAGRSAQRLKINLSHVVSLPGSRILFIYGRASFPMASVLLNNTFLFHLRDLHLKIDNYFIQWHSNSFTVEDTWSETGLTLQPDPPCWAKMFKNKQKKILFKTQVVTMCSFSSGKPANIIAMFDTIFKTSRVKCYSSLPMLLRAPRACLASVLPQTVLPTILPIWSPLDQLASAPVRWWSQPPGLCQHLPHTLELQPLLLKQLGWCHSQALKATYFYRLPPKENRLISKQGTKKQTCYHWKSHDVPIYI